MMAKSAFRKKLQAKRPDLVAHQEANARKRELALRLRALRKAKGLTQRDIERISGLDQSVVSRLEAPSGPFPMVDTIERYVEACGGHAGVAISADAFGPGMRELVV